jgi:Rieske Fe-S protein
MHDDGLPRRTLLVLGGAAAAQLATGCAILRGGAAHPSYSPTEPPDNNMVRIPLEQLKRLERGEALLVKLTAPAPDLLVTQLEDETYRAAAADCTHQGCTIDFSLEAKEWQCPCHGSRFSLDGKVLEGPADEPLPQAEVRVEGDQLIVDYSKV